MTWGQRGSKCLQLDCNRRWGLWLKKITKTDYLGWKHLRILDSFPVDPPISVSMSHLCFASEFYLKAAKDSGERNWIWRQQKTKKWAVMTDVMLQRGARTTQQILSNDMSWQTVKTRCLPAWGSAGRSAAVRQQVQVQTVGVRGEQDSGFCCIIHVQSGKKIWAAFVHIKACSGSSDRNCGCFINPLQIRSS